MIDCLCVYFPWIRVLFTYVQREVAVVWLKMCLLSYKDVISLSVLIYHRLGGKGE
jgi:hypothetical protein